MQVKHSPCAPLPIWTSRAPLGARDVAGHTSMSVRQLPKVNPAIAINLVRRAPHAQVPLTAQALRPPSPSQWNHSTNTLLPKLQRAQQSITPQACHSQAACYSQLCAMLYVHVAKVDRPYQPELKTDVA